MKYDVTIVGAGPAGSATALLLARKGCRVALLERSDLNGQRVGESLAPAVQPLLRDLGLWDAFLFLKPLPSYGTQSVWGSADVQSHSHIVTPYGRGWHIDRLAFDRMMVREACAAGADLQLNSRVTHWRQQRGCWTIQCATAAGQTRELQSAVLIDATGRSASLGHKLGARRMIFDRLVGIAAQVIKNGAASECFTQVETAFHGWWYSAPIAADRLVATLMTDSDLVRSGALHTPTGWLNALFCAPITGRRLRLSGDTPRGRLDGSPRLSCAVSQRLIRNDTTAPWLAVGDAALAVDPVSGSGVIRALRTAQAAASTVLQLLCGDTAVIPTYESDCNDECTRYLEERAAYYSAERRWLAAPFWQRRDVTSRVRESQVQTI